MSVTHSIRAQILSMFGKLTEYMHYFNRMSVPDAQWVFKNPEAAIGIILARLSGVAKVGESGATPYRPPMNRLRLKPWRWFTIGGPQRIFDYELARQEHLLGTELARCKTNPLAKSVQFVLLTPHQLGFLEEPMVSEIFSAKMCEYLSYHSLDGCEIRMCYPPDVVWIYRGYQDPPRGESFYFVAETQHVGDGLVKIHSVFDYECCGGEGDLAGEITVRSRHYPADMRLNLGDKLLFRYVKKPGRAGG